MKKSFILGLFVAASFVGCKEQKATETVEGVVDTAAAVVDSAAAVVDSTAAAVVDSLAH